MSKSVNVRLILKAQKISNVKIDVYKGYTMSGDYGYIARPFGRNEIYLGKNLKEANETLDAKISEKNS